MSSSKPNAAKTVNTKKKDDSRFVRFTVTPVINEPEPEPATNHNKIPHDQTARERSISEGDSENGPLIQESVNCTLQVPDITSDNDSSYGDTLTQTSITKLLSKKFKSYKTYKYDVAKKRAKEKEEKEGQDEKIPKESKPKLRARIVSQYESQDYDICENKLFLKEQESLRSLKIQRKWLARWFVMLLIGIGTAIVASLIEISIEFTAHYKFLSLKKLVDWCDTGSCLLLPLFVWMVLNAFLVFLGASLVTFLEPQAAGSGIPQIKCYLNGVKIPGLLTLKALLAKALGVTLSVAGGLACGKEGPMIHSGAIVAAGVSQGRSRMFKTDFKMFEYLRSDTERRDFVSGGAAAGVAAAFGAPVGGVLFSLEEGASFWNQSLTWRIVFASMVATFTVNLLLSAIHGHPSDLSNPGLISFGQFPDIIYQAIEIPIFLLMAVLGGLSGALFNYINFKLTVFRRRFIVLKWLRILEAVVVAAMSAVLGFILMYAVNDCVPKTTDSHDNGDHTSSHNVQLFCPDGQYNIMSSIVLKTPEESLVSLLHGPQGSYSVLSLALFSVLYFLLACWTYGLSVSSGVFIPSLLTGAAWGRLIGMGVISVFGELGSDYEKYAKGNNIGKYALIGAACQLGGTVRMTISLTVILIECTGDITFGLPIVMSLIIAKWVGDFFNAGLYDLHIQMMGIPLLPWDPPEMSYNVTASQVMSSPVSTVRIKETVGRILDVLEKSPHCGFPVVVDFDPEKLEEGTEEKEVQTFGRCRGLILRSQLILILKSKAFCTESSSDGKEIKLEDFRDAYARYINISDMTFSETEKEASVNLELYMNPTPYVITCNTSLPRMFKLFRGLGLRHLLVVNETNQILGMVTRKDLAKYRTDSKIGSVRMQELHIQYDY